MTDRIPSGTRDVLPDEMRELRAITEAVRGVFEARGYGEIYTPALEYASTLERAELAHLVGQHVAGSAGDPVGHRSGSDRI